MPIILHTKEEVHSQNNKLSVKEKEQLKQEFNLKLKRLKRFDRPNDNQASPGYRSSGPFKPGLVGSTYQLYLLMLFAWHSYQDNENNKNKDNSFVFRLATEMDDAEKFDDVVLEYSKEMNKKNVFLQAKHVAKKITVTELLSEKDDDFSLQKYFRSFLKIRKRFGDTANFVIYTSTDFDDSKNERLNLREALTDYTEEIEVVNKVIRPKEKGGKTLHFKSDFHGKDKLDKQLERTSDLIRLAKELAKCVTENKKITNSGLVKLYRTVLNEKIIDNKQVKFSESFKNGKGQEEYESPTSSPKRIKLDPDTKVKNFKDELYKSINTNLRSTLSWKEIEDRLSLSFIDNFKLKDLEKFIDVFTTKINEAESNQIKEVAIDFQKNKEMSENIKKLAGYLLVKVKKDSKNVEFSQEFYGSTKLAGNFQDFKEGLEKKLKKKCES